MSDKPVAGLVAAILVLPVCAICLLGPAALIAILAGVAGWLRGIDPVVTAGLGLAIAIVVFGLIRRRAGRRPVADIDGTVNE